MTFSFLCPAILRDFITTESDKAVQGERAAAIGFIKPDCLRYTFLSACTPFTNSESEYPDDYRTP